MHEFNQSLKYDKRMYAADVKGSIAFSKALLKAEILVEKEQKEIERGLKVVEGEWENGEVSEVLYLSFSSRRNEKLMQARCSSSFSLTTRISILPMNAGFPRSSERILVGSCILGVVGMIRSRRTCEFGWCVHHLLQVGEAGAEGFADGRDCCC